MNPETAYRKYTEAASAISSYLGLATTDSDHETLRKILESSNLSTTSTKYIAFHRSWAMHQLATGNIAQAEQYFLRWFNKLLRNHTTEPSESSLLDIAVLKLNIDLGIIWYWMGKYPQADQILRDAHQTFMVSSNQEFVQRCAEADILALIYLAWVSFQQRNYIDADALLNDGIQSIEILREYNEKVQLIDQLATVCATIDNPEKAVGLVRKSLHMIEAFHDSDDFLEYQVKLSCALAALFKEINRFELSSYYSALAIQISIRASIPYSHLLESLRMTFYDYDSDTSRFEKFPPAEPTGSKEALLSLGSGITTSPTGALQSIEASQKSCMNQREARQMYTLAMDWLVVEAPEIEEGSSDRAGTRTGTGTLIQKVGIGRQDEVKILQYFVKSSLQDISRKVVERFENSISLISPIGLMIITESNLHFRLNKICSKGALKSNRLTTTSLGNFSGMLQSLKNTIWVDKMCIQVDQSYEDLGQFTSEACRHGFNLTAVKLFHVLLDKSKDWQQDIRFVMLAFVLSARAYYYALARQYRKALQHVFLLEEVAMTTSDTIQIIKAIWLVHMGLPSIASTVFGTGWTDDVVGSKLYDHFRSKRQKKSCLQCKAKRMEAPVKCDDCCIVFCSKKCKKADEIHDYICKEVRDK